MAQHVPIEFLTNKIFRSIEEGIKKDFNLNRFSTSLKYTKLVDLIGEGAIKDYRENPNDEVYTTNRYIGKGVVWGTSRGYFEIHYDKVKKEIINIYLVA